MLTIEQVEKVWERMIEAEVRALYFGDLANYYTRWKQWITGGSFFLSSGAAATVIAKAPTFVPVGMSAVVALAQALAIAWNLDSAIRTMATLNKGWSEIAAGYERVYSDPYTDQSEISYHQIGEKERELSMLATTDAPNDQKRLGKWQKRVLELRHLRDA